MIILRFSPTMRPVTQSSRNGRGGFALVVSVMLMILLAILALGMLSLSAVALRTSGQGQAEASARANARLAMMLALGELQRTMGPDQRVSAPAAAVTAQARQPHLTGAWESWRWQPGAGSPDYSAKSSKFLGWLVSGDPEATDALDYPGREPSGDLVDLVTHRQGSGGQSTLVRAGKVPVTSTGPQGKGAFAWMVSDESVKAAVDLADPDKDMDASRELASRTAPNRFRADVLDPVNFKHLLEPKNFVSLETAAVAGENSSRDEIRRRFHDLTTGTLGLLTNTAGGGMKEDLSTLLSSSSFDSSLFGGAETVYDTSRSGAPRWSFLHDHYRKFSDPGMSAGTGGPVYTRSRRSLTTDTTGKDPSPDTADLLPSIAKLQVVFSMVTHPENRAERVARAPVRQRTKYAIPMLVYESVVTLHNPYDIALRFENLRFRVWNPPVGFRIAKVTNGVPVWLRKEWQDDPESFHGLGRFNRDGQSDTQKANQRFFTVQLTDGTSKQAGRSLVLQPGEVKVFSARVEQDWTWGWEWGLKPRRPWQFLDWFDSDDLAGAANRDLRSPNPWGVEAVPGWDLRAGLQMNHLSMEGGGKTGQRPAASFYPFEDRSYHWVADPIIHFNDDVIVQMRPEKTTNASQPDSFRVDLLAGKVEDFGNFAGSRDLLRSYRFRFSNPTEEISADPASPIIERRFNVGDILQTMTDRGKGGKKPMAMLEMTARTTKDELDDSKAWAFNNPVVEGGDIFTDQVGLANQSHDLRLIELTGWASFPMVEWDPAEGEGSSGFGRGYFGASRTSSEGVTNVPMYRVPIAPASSLGDLIPANLVTGSQLPRVVHAFGNSRAHPLIPCASVVNPNLAGRRGLDHSYFLNDALWDRYYFSSVTDMPALPWLSSAERNWQQILRDLLEQREPALNNRLTAIRPVFDADEAVASVASLGEDERARELGRLLAVKGPFNVNSTSVDAWRAVLSSLRDQTVTGWGKNDLTHSDQTPFARMSMPLVGPNQTTTDINLLGQIRWAGFRALSDAEISRLAEAIVEQIRERGRLDKAPPLSLAEFVNRRVGEAGQLHALNGLLQTAIDQSGINEDAHALDSKTISSANMTELRKHGAETPEAMDGFTGEGSPGMVTQGDLMMMLAPVATVRGDTFKIRAYGEARAADGKSVLARAWCEAVVQRIPDFVDPADAPAERQADLKSLVNQRFGRRFEMVSFRWLNPKEL